MRSPALPDPVDPAALAESISGRWAGPVEWHPSIDSTNRELADRARAGAEEGLLIGADHQTAGRGRRGRPWHDEPGASLAMSLLLRPGCAADQVGMVAIVAAVGVAAALQNLTGRPAEIVWPNDVLLDGAKTSGILCESALSASGVQWVVVGMGINVATTPAGIEGRWTPGSLAAAGFDGRREDAAAQLLVSVSDAYRSWQTGGAAPTVQAFNDRDALRDHNVVVETPEGEIRGRGGGVDALGRLLVTETSGVRPLAAGEVTRVHH